jgi:hypothetical protein
MSNAAFALEGATGLVLDRYRPLRPLGSGGSGSVWLARDEKTGLDVALKIVPREGKAGARAEREAAAAARLRHPGCLRAYAFARDTRNAYIAYEFVPGRTYREAMRAGALPDAAAIEACAQVCEALAHAHATGILHRDVKPANVLLAEADGAARLLDFGLAQMAEAETLTAQGDVPGTLAYIAPERLGGAEATEAADVWAVGVMLWESLAGRHPFWQTSMLETARAIERGADPLASLRPDLPKPLLQLVDRALALDPARRPAAAELAQALRGAAAPRRRKVPTAKAALPHPAAAAGPAALAALVAGWTAAELPFFPHGWAVGLALLAAVATAVRPRLGVAVALAVPVLPLGNDSLGLAVLYALLAAAWLVASWRTPRAALLPAVAPLLGLVGALGLMPLAVMRLRSPFHRAAHVALGIVLAGIVAGVRGAPLPFTGAKPPLALGIAGSTGPLDVAGTLARAAGAHSALLIEAAVFAAVAVAFPYVRGRGRWPAAALAGAALALSVLAVPAATPLPLVVTAWITAGALLTRVP